MLSLFIHVLISVVSYLKIFDVIFFNVEKDLKNVQTVGNTDEKVNT